MAKPIDLARVRAAEARLAAVLRDHPEIAERTARFLAGDPSLITLETLMSDALELTVQLRLPRSLVEQADAFIPLLAGNAELSAMGRVSRAAVLRLAIVKGLAALQQEYGTPPAPQPARGRRGRR